MDKLEWLAELQLLVGAVPKSSQVEVHQGTSGLGWALNVVWDTTVGTELGTLKRLLEEWESAGFGDGFDPSVDRQREKAKSLGGQIVASATTWLDGDPDSDQVETVKKAKQSAQSIVTVCTLWEAQRTGFYKVWTPLSERASTAISTSASVKPLVEDRKAVVDAVAHVRDKIEEGLFLDARTRMGGVTDPLATLETRLKAAKKWTDDVAPVQLQYDDVKARCGDSSGRLRMLGEITPLLAAAWEKAGDGDFTTAFDKLQLVKAPLKRLDTLIAGAEREDWDTTWPNLVKKARPIVLGLDGADGLATPRDRLSELIVSLPELADGDVYSKALAGVPEVQELVGQLEPQVAAAGEWVSDSGGLKLRVDNVVKLCTGIDSLTDPLTSVESFWREAKGHAAKGAYTDAKATVVNLRKVLDLAEKAAASRKKLMDKLAPISKRYDKALLVDQSTDETEEAVTTMKGWLGHVHVEERGGRYEDGVKLLPKLDEAITEVLIRDTEARLMKDPPQTMFSLRSYEDQATDHYVSLYKELLDLPDGKKVVDKLVSRLDPNSTDHGKLLEAAVKAAYGIELKQLKGYTDITRDESGWDKSDQDKDTQISSKRYYQLLSRCPESHVKDNPKFTRVLSFEERKGGAAYWETTKSAYMYCGRAGKHGSSNQGEQISSGVTKNNKGEVVREFWPDGRDDDALPKDDKPVSYFDWATMHEVGHAVDAGAGFMDSKAGGSSYGGWKEHTQLQVAQIGARHFGVYRSFVNAVLTDGETPDRPDKPDELAISEQDWTRRLNKALRWARRIRVKNMWWDGAASKANAIDGRVYQQAYDGDWNSYELDARKKGIHGYQFRAPGEWFAELYAAYYCDKLKDSHPFVSDLETLGESRDLSTVV